MSNPPPLALEDAQARLLALAAPLPVERVDIASALGRYLAEPLIAQRTQPACDLSAMDGYAVAADDLAGPWTIVGESAAGHPFAGTMAPGQAVRIATGAMLPEGAGGVIVQEDLVASGAVLTLHGTAPAPAGKHIRRTGMDFTIGAALAAAGTRVGPALIALALMAGHSHVAVRRVPRLAIIDSGDELAADPAACALHQIPASNGAMLAALAASEVCELTRLGPVADHKAALQAAFAAATSADIIVTSGGASVGDHDLVRPALDAWGASLDFWRVAIKPGKPLLVAKRGRQIVLGLPGNPVSSHVTAFLFLLPLLRHFAGAADVLPRAVNADLRGTLPAGGDRREFRRGWWDGAEIMPETQQDSGALAALSRSNALIERDANAPAAGAGEKVRIYPFPSHGNA